MLARLRGGVDRKEVCRGGDIRQEVARPPDMGRRGEPLGVFRLR